MAENKFKIVKGNLKTKTKQQQPPQQTSTRNSGMQPIFRYSWIDPEMFGNRSARS